MVKGEKRGRGEERKTTPSLAWDKGCGCPFCSHNAFSVVTLTNLSLLSLGRCCRGVEKKGEAMMRSTRSTGEAEDAQHMLATLFKDILYSNNV